ncbi:MAG: crossover junction endodeoxyribonuclease RuvC [Sandaracinaceae bacterium]
MIIVAFDPGAPTTGWCAVDARGGKGRPVTTTFWAGGVVESQPQAIHELLATRQRVDVERIDVVAVERLEGFAFPSKGPGIVSGLIAGSRAAGVTAAIAWSLGIRVVEMTANTWRRLVLGRPAATDALIANVIPRLVHGWPKRSNVHVRDAGGLALGVAWHLGGHVERAPVSIGK